MDAFLLKIININEKINKSYEKSKTSKKITNIVSPAITTKQYLLYYLYRILCKNRKLIKKVVPQPEIRKVYKKLGVPKGRKICYALGNRMSNNFEYLEEVLTDIIEILNKFHEGKSTLMSSTYEDFEGYLVMKVQGRQIKNDLEELAKLIPNLSIAENFTSKSDDN